ncbi:hypothetical protein [Methylobacter sp. sgz302048]|uniref:hypothetical protein n=1 Tax=Methylobacter sp. sgz302048 TaxID=3455945 RepID=UPI003FA0EBC6
MAAEQKYTYEKAEADIDEALKELGKLFEDANIPTKRQGDSANSQAKEVNPDK